MARIKVTCFNRHDTELHADKINVVVVGTLDDVSDESFYTFECLVCGDQVSKPADQRIVDLLRSGGCQARLRTSHPEDPPYGPPLNFNDFLDFKLLLNTPGWELSLTTLDQRQK